MPQVNRETLKEYFKAGTRPSGQQFKDLIDSMLNILDDGLDRSDKEGLKLSPLDNKGSVLEFFRDIQDAAPLWKIIVETGTRSLIIADGETDRPVITLSPDRPIRLHTDVEVEGGISANYFRGNYTENKSWCSVAKADGKWHTVPLLRNNQRDGCRAYHIVAGCGKTGYGKYALLDAIAMHCYGRHKKIKSTNSWFGVHFNRIQLRWCKEDKNLVLQIRTRSNFGDNVFIRYHIEETWNDYYMNREINIPAKDEPAKG